ncbi:MAG: IS3 family transposase, partial [Myxococcales bacterium]|nr:IS3 family transposase [Myxococcales bacterium]
ETLRQAQRVVGDYIENYYNANRMHSTLDYNSPIEYEQIRATAAE